MAATGKEAVSARQARAMARKIMTDLTNQTNRTIQEAVHAEAEAREKADQLLETEVDGKLDAADLVAGANVTITPDPETGHVTIAAADSPEPAAYTAGEGLALSGHEFSIADGAVTAGKIALGVIPDVSGFITADQAAEAYQPKGDYITAAQAAETYQPKGSYQPAGDYITQAEGDAAYQPKGSYAPFSHTHTVSQITDFPEIPDITIASDSLAKGYLGY